MMKKILLLMILLSFALTFGQTKVGSTAAPFLTMSVGPRATSMGGAFVATANDVTALHWNPAGISRAEKSSALFTYNQWFADIKYNWAGSMINLGGSGTIGFSLGYLDYGSIEVTTLQEPEGTGESFTPKDMVLALTYAYNLTDRFSVGGNIKYVNQKIWNSSASAVAMDLGVLFISEIYGLRIGATISNFGTDMKMDGKDLYVQYDLNSQQYGNNDQILAKLNTDSYPLPLTFRVGLAIDPVKLENHRLTLGMDMLHPNDNAESINIGMEYQFYNFVSLRSGYKALLLNNSEEGLTLGFGLNYDISPALGLFIDYCYQDFGKLNYSQQFAVGINF